MLGEHLHWEVTVSNVSNVTASDVVVSDLINDNMRVIEPRLVIISAPAGTTVNETATSGGNFVEVEINRLEPGQEVVYEIITQVVSGRVFENTVTSGDESADATLVVERGSMILAAPPPLPAGPIPIVNQVPDTEGFAGSQTCFTAEFINAGTNPGFGPYVTIVFEEGLTFNTADFLGIDLTAAPFAIASGTVPAGGWDAPDDPIEGRPIPEPPNYDPVKSYTWRTFRLPVGSVVTGGPALEINICYESDPLAEIGEPLTIDVYPGYEFGDTATGDNGPISNLDDVLPMGNHGSFTPVLITLDKFNDAPESERPPGPIWTYTYTITSELAPGQTVTNVIYRDDFPAELAYVDGSLAVGGSCTLTPAAGNQTLPGAGEVGFEYPLDNGEIIIEFDEISNPSVTDTCDIEITYDVFIKNIICLDAAGTNPDPCFDNIRAITNTATLDFDWQGNPQPQLEDQDTVTAENTVFQKGVSSANVVPDDIVDYTINFQVNEYGGVAQIIITDTIPDGIEFVSGSASVTVPGVGTAPITGANADLTCGVDTCTLIFNVTGALTGPYPAGSSGTITYQGEVMQEYRPGGALNGFVSAADTLTNSIIGEFTMVDGASFENDSSASVLVRVNELTKELISAPLDASVGFVPGEPVTFRITLEIPSGDTRNVTIEDFFPLPVFAAADTDFGIQGGTLTLTGDPDNLDNTTGYCSTYPNATFPAYTTPCGVRVVYPETNLPPGSEITVTSNAATNSVLVELGQPVTTTDTETRVIALDFTMAIVDEPFNDGLFLSNIAESFYENSAGEQFRLDDIDFLGVAAPNVILCKGVEASSNPSSTFVDAGECSPGNDDDLEDADASDQITYLITLTNIGGARAYNVRVSDDVLSLPNLTGCSITSVTNGLGTPVGFSGDLTSGITLTAPILAGRSTSTPAGQEIVQIRVGCTILPTLPISSDQIINTATALFTSFVPDTNPPDFPPSEDVARVSPRLPEITKTRTPATVTIGDIVEYTLTIEVPGGTMSNMTVVDTLDPGLAFIERQSFTVGAGVTVGNNPPADAVAAGGGSVTWNLGNVINAGTTGDDTGTITITYTAVVLNVSGNVRGQTLGNEVALNWQENIDSGDGPIEASAPDVTVIEPTLQINKSIDNPGSAEGDAGDIVSYELTISHTGPSNSPAHDVTWEDPIPAGMTYQPGTLSFAGILPTISDDTGNPLTAYWPTIAVGESVTITYDVRVDDDVIPAQLLENETEIAWQSLSGDPGQISPFNPNAHQRTGDPNDPGEVNNYNDDDDAVFTVIRPETQKIIIDTSEPSTGTGQHDPTVVDMAIGEFVTYQITLTLIEGVNQGLVFVDSTPVGLGLISAEVIAIGGNLTGSNVPVGTIVDVNNQPANTSYDPNEIVITFGDITNDPDNVVNADDQIVIEIVAQLLDHPANVNGLPVTNNAALTYDTPVGDDTASDTVDIEVVEPNLVVNKTVTNPDPPEGDAGTVITYQVEIQNTGTSIAFDVVVVDDLSGLPVTYVPGSLIAADSLTAEYNPGTQTITVNYVEIPIGATRIITYQVTLDDTVSPGLQIENVAASEYYSLPDGTNPERRLYDEDDSAIVETIAPEVNKEVFDTSEGTGNDQVVIGEVITYRITMVVPEGSGTALLLEDTLPAGTTYISSEVISIGAHISNSLLAVGASGTHTGGVVTFDFGGNLVNLPSDGIVDDRDQIVVQIVVRVDDVPTNTSGDALTNTVELTYNNNLTVSDTADLEIIEPELAIVKSAAPTTGLQAGDAVTYTLTVSHTADSTADAYNVSVIDPLLTTLDLDPATFTVATTGAGVITVNSGNTAGDTDIDVFLTVLEQGETLTITFQALVNATVTPGETLTNVATVESYSLQDPNDPTGREYSDDDDASVGTETVFELVKTATTPHTIGELVTYTLTLNLIQGTTENVVITDVLPDDLQYVALTSATTAGTDISGTVVVDSSAPPDVTFTLGDVTIPSGTALADRNVTIVFTARVMDSPANNSGDTKTNDAEATADGGLSDDDDATTLIIEPELVIVKLAAPTMGLQAGDTVTYTLTVNHTGASTADAYNVSVVDPLLTTLDLDPATFTVTTTGAGVITVNSGNTAGDTDIDVFLTALEQGETLTITFEALVNATVTPGQTLTNVADLVYESLPDDTNDERRIYTDDDDATVETIEVFELTKTATTPHTIGDVVQYELALTLTLGTTNDVVITDVLPDDLAYIAGSIEVLPAAGVTTGFVDEATSLIYAAGTRTLTIDLDTVVASIGSTATVAIRYQARVLDSLANNSGDTKTNDAEATADGGLSDDAEADTEIVEPQLEINKIADPVIGQAGDIITFEIEIQHTGASNSDAFDVVITDPIPGDTTYVSGSLTCSDAPTTCNHAAGLITVAYDSIPLGETRSFSFQVTLDDSVTLSQIITNVAELTYWSLPDDPVIHGGERRQYTDDDDAIVTVINRFEMTKTASGPHTIGDNVQYEIQLRVPEGATDNLIITDILPTGMEYIAGTLSVSHDALLTTGFVDEATNLTYNVPTRTLMLDLGTADALAGSTGVITIRYQAVILASPANQDGDIKINNASASADGGLLTSSSAGTVIFIIPPPPGAPDSDEEEAATPIPGVIVPGAADGVDVCPVECVTYEFYHTNHTGNWEIFRLGNIPGRPGATANVSQGFGEGVHDVAPSRSPNGEWVAFTSNRDGNWEVYIGAVDGSEQRRVTFNDVAKNTNPSWGPNNFLAFESTRDGNWEIYVLNLETGDETRLTTHIADDLNPSWSPDGTRVLFQSNRTGAWQIYEHNIMTGQTLRLSDGAGNDMDARYDNAGGRILFRSYRGENTENSVLYIMNADGSNPRPISDPAGNASNASWSPDDAMIAYQSDRGGALNIYVYDVATAVTRQITDSDDADYAPTWLCDTSQILFTSDTLGDNNIFRVDVLPLDGDPIIVEEDADRLTFSSGDDIYPLGTPLYEHASREGILPGDGDFSRGQTRYLEPDTDVTPIDPGSERGVPWEPIDGCTARDLAQLETVMMCTGFS